MSDFTIYHNPRCSKSRQTLALLQENGVEPEVIEYIKTPLTETEIKSLLKKLSLSASQLVRKQEADFKALKLTGANDSQLIKAMASYPKLIERPIVVKGNQATLGRPPENCLALLEAK